MIDITALGFFVCVFLFTFIDFRLRRLERAVDALRKDSRELRHDLAQSL